ncbi:MAG: alpha/beta hydrolase [Puniceicoccaceae bacterium]
MRGVFRRSMQMLIVAMAGLVSGQVLYADYAFEARVVGEGQALILIPGLGCSGEVWQESVSTLSQSRQCHILTLPGFAGVPAVAHEGNYVEFIKTELKRYLEQEPLERPVLVGHSLGGFIGLLLACEADSGLAGLVIVDSLPFLPAAMNPGATEASAKGMASGMVQQAQSMQPDQHRQMLSTMITDPEHIEEALKWSSESDRTTVSQAMMELYTTDLRDDIADIRIPVLVMGSWVAYKNFGATRESTESIFRAQYAALPQVEIKMTDVGKHFIMWDDPEFFLNETVAFLER